MARSKVSKQRSDRLTQTVSSIQNIPLATHGRSIDLRVDSSSTDDSRLRGALPCVDGSGLARAFFTHAGWSVQPCVRPFSAVHMTAGHNALRGSGPGQKPAFENAVAQVGCPDRRIDRLCITCCSPSQPSHHARYLARSRYGLSATG
jgi:hypothetical protein